MMDGRYITEARTAAVSAVSTRFLARADAATLAIIGSGVQARSHLEAYQHVRQLKDVRIWSPQPAEPPAVRRRHEPARVRADHRRRVRRSRGARRRSDRARDLVAHAGDRGCVGRPSGAHVVCVGACRPDSAGNAAGAGASAAGCTSIRATRRVLEAGDIVMNIAARTVRRLAHPRRDRRAGARPGRRPQVRQRHHDLQVARHGRGRRGRRRPRVSTRVGNRRGNGADVMNDRRSQPAKKRRWIPIVLGILFAVRRARHRRGHVHGVVVPAEHDHHARRARTRPTQQFDEVRGALCRAATADSTGRRPAAVRRASARASVVSADAAQDACT